MKKFANALFSQISNTAFAVGIMGVMATQNTPQIDFETTSAVPDYKDVQVDVLPAKHFDLKRDVFIQFGAASAQLSGQVEFCKRVPKECAEKFKDGAIVILTDDLAREIAYWNEEINGRYQQQSDFQTYGEEERWAYPQDAADCEDLVLIKRWEFSTLLKIPANAMSIIHVQTAATPDNPGGGHAVLAIRTDMGDLILDNLNDDPKFPYETGYEFIGASSFENFQKWREASLYKEKALEFPDKIPVPMPRPER